jgi:hypothetical protein
MSPGTLGVDHARVNRLPSSENAPPAPLPSGSATVDFGLSVVASSNRRSPWLPALSVTATRLPLLATEIAAIVAVAGLVST